jgi:putative ABC transport system permease protein
MFRNSHEKPRFQDRVLQDIRFGTRMLAKNPGFATVALVTLALGLGAATALFAIADAVLRKDPDWYRSGAVIGYEPQRKLRIFNFSVPDFRDLSRLNDIFETAGALYWTDSALTSGEYPERVGCAHVTYTELARKLPAERGRFFRPDEDLPGGPEIAVLSDEFWASHFSRDPAMIGKRIRLDSRDYTVVGVTRPHESSFGSAVMVPAQLDLADQDRSRRGLWVLVTLREGVTWEHADARLSTFGRNLAQDLGGAYPEYAGLQLQFWNAYQANTTGIKPVFVLLLLAVGVLLVICATNTAVLLLARSSARAQEFTVRTALGASRRRIIGQCLTESVALAVMGCAGGIVVALLCLPGLIHLIPASWLTVDPEQIRLKPEILLAVISLATFVGIAFGAAPALQSSRTDLAEALNAASFRISGDRRSRSLRNVLVVTEIGLTLAVLTCAVLTVASYRNLERIDLGFRPDHVLSLQIALPGTKYPDAPRIGAFFRSVVERVQALPAVDGAALVSGLPMLDRTVDLSTQDFTIEGRPAVDAAGFANATFRLASEDYFNVVGARLVRGRLFTNQDGPGSPAVAVINETMAREYWRNSDRLGARIRLQAGALVRANDPGPRVLTIVGVVSDIKQIRVIDAPVRQEFYVAQPQFAAAGRTLTMMVRSSADPAALTQSIRRAVQSLDPEQPIYRMETMGQVVTDSFSPKRIATVLLSFFGVVTMLLCAVGVYAIVSYSVAQRTREIGIRMALGARPEQAVRWLMREGCGMALAALALGLAAGISRLALHLQYRVSATGLLYGVDALVPWAFLGTGTLLLAVVLAACYFPARRAARVHPGITLRSM